MLCNHSVKERIAMVKNVTSPKKESPKISTAAEWKAQTSKEKTKVTTLGMYESMKHLWAKGKKLNFGR